MIDTTPLTHEKWSGNWADCPERSLRRTFEKRFFGTSENDEGALDVTSGGYRHGIEVHYSH